MCEKKKKRRCDLSSLFIKLEYSNAPPQGESVSTLLLRALLHAECSLYKYLISPPHLIHPLPLNNDSFKQTVFSLTLLSAQLF